MKQEMILIIFKTGKRFKRYAAKKVDGIVYLRSAQEVAEPCSCPTSALARQFHPLEQRRISGSS